ncbi:MAG: hypothetical protein EXS14_01875 [Planctomycetes bacterium]|nr:hypothetical protein [Planctomycetota bacterium]
MQRDNRPSAATFAGVFLIAFSVLLLEVAITRVFAIVMWHHFAYMVISLALLGFGASGSLLTARGASKPAGLSPRAVTFAASAYGAAVVAAFMLVTRIEVDSLEIWNDASGVVGLLGCFLALSLPFLMAGLALGGTFTRHPKHISTLYGVDLIGSACGGAFAPLLLESYGSTATVMLAAGIGALAALAFSRGLPPRVAAIPCALTIALTFACVGFCGGFGVVPALNWHVPFAPHKEVPRLFPDGKSETTLHSATAQVDISNPTEAYMSIGGHFGDVDWMRAEQRAVTQDGTAPTVLYKDASSIERFPALDDSQAASGYIAHRAAGRKKLDVLVIGCGGGVDVMTALYCGAASVVAVDVNTAMIHMVKSLYANYIGHLFDDPRVTLVNAEGRAYARSSDKLYDQIQLSGVDTYTALASGAYTLSESYLYTVEAVRDFVEHLKPDGIVTWSRFMMTYPKQARETIRLANIARTALEDMGTPEPWRHIVVLQAHGWASTMVKRSPWTEQELVALREFSAKQNFLGMVFDPGRGPDGPFEGSRMATITCKIRADAALRDAAQSISGVSHDGPVPAEWSKAATASFRAAADGDNALSERLLDEFLTTLPVDVRAPSRSVLLQATENLLGFMKAEATYFKAQQLDFATLIRGERAEHDAFVANYFYDLSPSRDDRPFFFDYFRLSRFREAAARKGDWKDEYHPDFPVGHMVLLTSVLQIMVLAAVFILLPLRRLRHKGVVIHSRWRWFAWFGALGVGFMFLEIALMQKLTLFLGHPAYALSVVLTGMLAFSGLGSLLSARVKSSGARSLTLVVLGIAVLGVANALWLGDILDALLGLSFTLRVGVAMLILAPISLLLGMPFPLGIRALEGCAPTLVPWGWAVNGFLSVLSSMLATLMAMQTGFAMLLFTASILYVLGLLAVRRLLPVTA